MSDNWNARQLDAIENIDGNMLVSASAGSGKTSVMIERTKRQIIHNKVPVSRILMLSFNEDIAEEIKAKMAKTLINEVKTSDDKDFLREQIDSLGMSDITTMHGFCNSLVKEYFDVVGIDPAYGVMDDQESDVVVNKTINEIFDDYFEKQDADFILLKDKLSANGDDDLRSLVKNIFNYSNSLVDGDEWLEKAYNDNYKVPLYKTKPVKILTKELINKTNDALEALEDAVNVLDESKYPDIFAVFTNLAKYENEENILKYEELALHPMDITTRRNNKDEEIGPYINNAKNTYETLQSLLKELFPVPYKVMEMDQKNDSVIMAKLIEIVRRFKTKYNREKAEVNKIDFNDMEHFAIEILSHEDIASEVRNRYDYICVDEYQDINAVQNKIINTVSKGDNLFMVGDPKQSIYKFRFTEPEIFVGKVKEYSKSKQNKMVELDQNYRSSPLILNDINCIFDVLMKNKSAGMISNIYSPLVNGQTFEDKISKPFEVLLYSVKTSKDKPIDEGHVYRISENTGADEIKKTAEIEAQYIAEKVDELLASKIYDVKIGDYRNVKLDDMAILAPSRSDLVKKVFDILEMDYHIDIDDTYLRKKEEPQEVKILTDFLRCIDNPRQDIPLYTVMKLFFDFTDGELVAMKREVGKTDSFNTIVFDDLLKPSAIKDKVDEFVKSFNALRFESTFKNVYDFLLSAIEKTGFKAKLLMSKNGNVAIDNVNKFVSTLKDKKHSSTIQEFLYAYEHYNITNDIDSSSQGMHDCMHATTIHKSKGLEYPIVFLINLGHSIINEQGKSTLLLDRELGIAVKTFDEKSKTKYSGWLIDGIKRKIKADDFEEKMRLFYVAMTRAKNCLYMCGQTFNTEKDIDNASKYTDWIKTVANSNNDFASCIRYEDYGDDDIFVHGIDNGAVGYEYKDYSQDEKADFERVFDYKYPHEDATRLAQKYTVTSINHEEREKEEYVPELYETEKTSVGTIYHKFMEYVNYEADTIDAIKAEFARMVKENILTQDEISNINIDDVYKCLNSAIIKKAKVSRHDREKKFMMCLPLSKVKEGASDEKVIIQGIADLVIYGDENILVDFKKSSRPDYLLKLDYKKQLDIYKYALEESMNIKIDKMYLYVIGRDSIIDMN